MPFVLNDLAKKFLWPSLADFN